VVVDVAGFAFKVFAPEEQDIYSAEDRISK
jgi:hypothetical protein